MQDVISVFLRCRATLAQDLADALSLAALLVLALHLPALF